MTEDQPWDRAATEQALSDEQSGSRNAHVMSAAGHVLCEAVKSYDLAAVEQAQDALMAAHDATTPSPNQTHVVVEKAEMERWRGIEKRLDETIEAAFPYGQYGQDDLIAIRDGAS